MRRTQVQSSLRTKAVTLCATCVCVFAGCESGDALNGRGDVVARVGDHELDVATLAEVIARGAYVPLEEDVVARMVDLWVDYSLIAQRLAAGDSLLDSATVLQTLWRDAQLQIISQYHDHIVSERVAVDAATVDSVYEAGEERLIYHILVRAPADSGAGSRATRRREAERLRALAAAGPAGWTRANAENDDSVARGANGRLGVISRGETVPEFDSAAFSLAPGETSEVTESDMGFHIIRRPPLEEVRSDFSAHVQEILIDRMNVGLVEELERRWEVKVESGAAELMREVVRGPPEDGERDHLLGTYRSGRFTTADLVRWLEALPVEYTAEARGWDDGALIKFLRGLMRNEVLAREARDAGYQLSDEGFAMLRESLAHDLDLLRSALGLDTLWDGVERAEDRSRLAASAVDRYLTAVTNDLALLVQVPPFLAKQLRGEMSWGISRTAIRRALAQGARLRVLMQGPSETGRQPRRDSTDVGEKGNER